MQLEAMDGSFRQADVVLHVVLGLLSWSGSLARSLADVELPGARQAAPPERPLSGSEQASLELLLGLISFAQTLHAALERVAAAAPTEPARAAGVEQFDLNLGR